MPLLLRMMLREEYRMHVAYSSKRMFLSLPLFVLAVSFATAMTLDNLTASIPLRDLLMNVNAGVFLYGLSVGAFGFLGRTYVERRQTSLNFIIASPSYLPLSFKKTFTSMYLRDIIFYIVLLLLPALAGLLMAAPFAHLSILSIFCVFISLLLSFLIGISLSFAMSVIYTRQAAVFAFLCIAIIATLVAYGLGFIGLNMLLPSVGFQLSSPPIGAVPSSAIFYLLASLSLFLLFSVLASQLVMETYEGKGTRVRDILPGYMRRMGLFRSYQPLIAKEVVDLRRSGSLGKMAFGFVAPLLFLSFTTWYVNNGLQVPVGFNTVFYAGMVGFFSVMLYSWLTNIDMNDYFSTLPVAVPTVIRTKLIAFLLLTCGISTVFVLVIAWMNSETRLLWLALPVLYITSVYSVMATAYLTGLNPNSFLFNPQILTKFAIVSILPDVGITILSFSIDRAPLVAVAGISLTLGMMAVSTLFFYRGIERKWSSTPFA